MTAPRDAAIALDFAQPTVIVRVMLTPDRAIDDYLGDSRARGWSERSIQSYAATLYRFADRLPADLDVSKIQTDDLRRYRASRQAKVSRNTLAGEEAHLASWLRWLYQNRKIAANPMDRLERTRRIPAEDLDVVTVSPADVPELLAAAHPGTERNAVAIPAYLGPRRHAVALLRRGDYDPQHRLMRFREKGAKKIVKPVPDELAAILDASIDRGEILAPPHDYLVPPEGHLSRKGDRDDRVIWRVVRRVADRAGVDSHVHALRAAFAVFYLERNPDDLLGLKELLGHRSLNTTLVYLRRLNKQAAMNRVRTLSWAATGDAGGAAWLSETPLTAFAASAVVGAGGFEPPSEDSPRPERRCGEHDPLEPLRLRLSELRAQADARPVDVAALLADLEELL